MDSVERLEERVKVIESQLSKSKSHLEVISDNGKYKIVLAATNQGAGVWITGEGFDSVDIHTGFNQGALVGLRSKENSNKPYDACIFTTEFDKGGYLQLADENQQVVQYSVEYFKK